MSSDCGERDKSQLILSYENRVQGNGCQNQSDNTADDADTCGPYEVNNFTGGQQENQGYQQHVNEHGR